MILRMKKGLMKKLIVFLKIKSKIRKVFKRARKYVNCMIK